MSWNRAPGGVLHNAPPSSTNPAGSELPISKKYKPNLGGQGAFQREQQLSRRYGGDDRGGYREERKTEWDVLRENHRFIRDDEEPQNVSWEERLARAYESKLFKEFALIDLKHYKSHRLALRWRTAPEVVEGIGEDTCGSLRCKHHVPPGSSSTSNEIRFNDQPTPTFSLRSTRMKASPRLSSFELPFVYSEAGLRKEALVKVRLCKRCGGKLVWKPREERSGREGERVREEGDGDGEGEEGDRRGRGEKWGGASEEESENGSAIAGEVENGGNGKESRLIERKGEDGRGGQRSELEDERPVHHRGGDGKRDGDRRRDRQDERVAERRDETQRDGREDTGGRRHREGAGRGGSDQHQKRSRSRSPRRNDERISHDYENERRRRGPRDN